jgi:ubiquitin carboxyl-terminal hydrolase 36/42
MSARHDQSAQRIDEFLSIPQKIIPRKITFVQAQNPANAHPPKSAGGSDSSEMTPNRTPRVHQPVDDFDYPSQYLFDPAEINLYLNWKNFSKIGCGLHNLGNTCFLNSVLQVLIYTPPLVQYMMTKTHSKKCGMQGFCFFCAMETLSSRCHSGQAAESPDHIVANLRSLSKTFQKYRQEDAHELLRFGLDALQKSWLSSFPKIKNPRIQETSFVCAVFGGYLRFQQ